MMSAMAVKPPIRCFDRTRITALGRMGLASVQPEPIEEVHSVARLD